MRIIAPFLISIFLLSSCSNKLEYSDIPEIEFKDFLLSYYEDALNNKTYLGILKFNVVDGDGDIGYYDRDTIYNYDTSKVYLTLYRKCGNEYVEKEDSLPYEYQIPYITPAGKSKSIKAEIVIEIFFPEPLDTMKFDFFIVDRAMNKSNVSSTYDFVFY